jgi:cell fate (sporulation/competence/biofilm development) regulator YmcA (YheA/YmcA/DUF963 family)
MDVLVFATNVTSERQVSKVRALLTNLPAVTDWNFDLDDCDHILRVVSRNVSPRDIEILLQAEGLHCNELAD